MSEADTGDVDPEDEYTDDGSVKWGGLAEGIAGIGITVVGYAWASSIGLLRDGITGLLDGIGSFLGSLVGAPFNTGADQLSRAAEAGGSALSVFGPFAFPAAVVVGAVTMTLILWGVSRFV